jgi:hypothetical protein
VFARGRDQVFQGLKAGLSGALADVCQRAERKADSYVLFANIDLTHDQTRELREAILEGYRGETDASVEIVGAAELAAMLNDLPHIRVAFFGSDEFVSWQCQLERHRNVAKFGADVEMVGRTAELEGIQQFTSDPGLRVLILYGPHQMGKSRLALEGTRDRFIDTVFALDGRTVQNSDLGAIDKVGTTTVLVVDDPDPETADRLTGQALAREGLKVIVTLPTAEDAPAPNFGSDDRVSLLEVGPLNDAESRELLIAAGAKLDYGIESWLMSQAGRNPGVLLLAANLGSDVRHETESFKSNVARAFCRRLARELGQEALDALAILSVLSRVTFAVDSQELSFVCNTVGSGFDAAKVADLIPRLRDAGVVQITGTYAEVVPRLLADNLATSLIGESSEKIIALMVGLSEGGRLRLVRRVSGLSGQGPAGFWSILFEGDGLLHDLGSALQNQQLLGFAAAAASDRVAKMVLTGLDSMSVDQRKQLAGESRRQTMWALEETLYRVSSSEAALRAIALLAEAETEHYANNATGVFSECFFPLHPQFPLNLTARRSVLEDLLASDSPTTRKLLVVEAIRTALISHIGIALRRSDGAEPFDSPPQLTYGEIWDYYEQIVDMLMKEAQSDDAPVSKACGRALPSVLRGLAMSIPIERALSRLEAVAKWCLEHETDISVSELSAEVTWLLRHQREKAEACDEDKDLATAIARLEAMAKQLEDGDLEIQIRRWSGGWHGDELTEIDGGRTRFRSEDVIPELAAQVFDSPDLISDDLLTWLCSPEAQKAHMLLYNIGERDKERRWLGRIQDVGREESGAIVFAAYFGGLSQSDRAFVSSRLDSLTESAEANGVAVVRATAYLGGDADGVTRVVQLLSSGRVNPELTALILSMGRWLDSLDSVDFERLICTIGGPDLEHALACIDLFRMWVYSGLPLEGSLAEFGWRCLEMASDVGPNDSYACDVLADRLAQIDPEKGLHLVRELLRMPYEKRAWRPIDRHGQNLFWNRLLEYDRKLAIREVLNLMRSDEQARFLGSWTLGDVIDQDRDRELLTEYADESEDHAVVISEVIAAERPGFWAVALKLLERYPTSAEIGSNVMRAIAGFTGRVFSGPVSMRMQSAADSIRGVLDEDEGRPPGVIEWLVRAEAELRESVRIQLLREAEDELHDLGSRSQDPSASERLWAIRQMIRTGRVDELLEIVSSDEVLELLPRLNLSDDEERAVEDRLA